MFALVAAAHAAAPKNGPFPAMEDACPPSNPQVCARESTERVQEGNYEELVVVREWFCGPARLYLRAQAGWYRLGIAAGEQQVCGDPFETDVGTVSEAHVENGSLVFRVRTVHEAADLPKKPPIIPGDFHPTWARETTYACRASDKGAACQSFTTGAAKIDKKTQAIAWRTTGKVVIDAAGAAKLVAQAGS